MCSSPAKKAFSVFLFSVEVVNGCGGGYAAAAAVVAIVRWVNVASFWFASHIIFFFLLYRFGSDSEGLIDIFEPMCTHYEFGIHTQNPKYAIRLDDLYLIIFVSFPHSFPSRSRPLTANNTTFPASNSTSYNSWA